MKKVGQVAGKIVAWILGGVVAVFCAIRLFYLFTGTAKGIAAVAYIIIRAILKLWPYLLAVAAIVGVVLAVRGYIRKRKDEAVQKLEAAYKEGFQSGMRTGKVAGQEEGVAQGCVQGREEGFTQGRKEGLAEGREEGYSLGHSEGYKYALYTQGHFRYYNDDPPLTYEDARRSLDEGQEGTNGELIQEAAEDATAPVESLGQQSAPVEKQEEPTTHRDYAIGRRYLGMIFLNVPPKIR